MKKTSLIIAILLSILITGLALAQTNLPGSGWWTGESVQNIHDTEDATVNATAYDQASSSTYLASKIISPGANTNFEPADFSGMPDGFQGSAMLSATGPIKAIVNVTNRETATYGVAGGKAAAQYQGTDSSMVDDAIYFPVAKGDSWSKTNTFYIQNTTGDAFTATATFTMRNGDVHVYNTPSIGSYQMVSFSLLDSPTYNRDDYTESNRVGSLVVDVDDPDGLLAGVAMEHYTTESPATLAQATRGFTSGLFDSTAFAPQIKNNRYGRSTGIQVQNVSPTTVPITVTVTYYGFAGDCAGSIYTDTATDIQYKAANIFNQMPGQTNLPENCTAAAQISTDTPDGQLVAFVSESYLSASIPASGQSSVTSYAIPGGQATTKVSLPIFKDDRYDKRTGLMIQNVGSSEATNIVATFMCRGGSEFTAISIPLSADPYNVVQFYTPSDDPALFEISNPFASNNVVCGVTVTADQPIVAIANESPITGGTFEQDNNNYEGFNLIP